MPRFKSETTYISLSLTRKCVHTASLQGRPHACCLNEFSLSQASSRIPLVKLAIRTGLKKRFCWSFCTAENRKYVNVLQMLRSYDSSLPFIHWCRSFCLCTIAQLFNIFLFLLEYMTMIYRAPRSNRIHLAVVSVWRWFKRVSWFDRVERVSTALSLTLMVFSFKFGLWGNGRFPHCAYESVHQPPVVCRKQMAARGSCNSSFWRLFRVLCHWSCLLTYLRTVKIQLSWWSSL